MQIISSYQLQKGLTAERFNGFNSALPTIAQPLQMLPYEEKDDNWRAWCMDWYEWQGIRMIQSKIRKKAKNYRLANGVIDKSDYISVSEDDETKPLIDSLTREDDLTSINELNFFPIIPNVIDLLVGEFSKRNNKVFPFAVDEMSKNEKLDKKKELIDNILVQQARSEINEFLVSQGIDPEQDEQAAQQLSDENIKTLPEVEKFISKNYRTAVEQWAGHQINADRHRFRMDELEVIGFRDSLIVDEEFWHIRMGENDYEPELWNPLYTFYHKSPNKRYISESNFVGHVELLTVADVIDTYGHMMNEDELLSLESILPATGANFLLNGQNDGFYYDSTRSVAENQMNGSLAYKQFMAFEGAFGSNTNSALFDWVMNDGQLDVLTRSMLRVTTCYFRSQRKLYHLTKIDDEQNFITTIVDETYKCMVKPIYDNTFYKENTKDNLIYGEHLDPIWIPEIWGGIKIGPNLNQFGYQSTPAGLKPIYLGMMGKKKPDRLPFQFKGTDSLYGSRIPVEGSKFSERNSKPMSLVDRMKPFQLAYNVVNNQIQDIIIDELGTVIIIDHNTLPKHSMGEEWGPNNLAKAYVAMKNFQMLPLDYSLENMENPSRFSNLTSLDASQTQRLLGRIQLSNYFRNEAYLAIGVTQERMGTPTQGQTATEFQMKTSASYSQTEKYFIQHSDWLMPRVYELMVNAAQYYLTKNPSTRLSYITENGEQFLAGLDDQMLLPRDINVFCTTTFQARELKSKLEQLALTNNTTGATIFDLGKVIAANTPSEIIDAMETVQKRVERDQQAQREHEKQLQQQLLDSENQKVMQENQFEASENEKDRRAGILEAQIRAAGYGSNQDINQNQQSDYLDSLKMIQQDRQYQNTMGFEREKEINRTNIEQQKLQAKRDEIQARKEIANKQLEIAKSNKNKYDSKK